MPLTGQDLAKSLVEMMEPPVLREDEREWLVQALQPGTPMWKILKAGVDHAGKLRDTIARADLTTPEGIESARQHQAVLYASTELIAHILSYANPKPKEPPHG